MKFQPNPLLYGAHEEFFSTFRLAIRMKETVDYELLARSVERVRVRYPYFCVFPERQGENLVLRYNERPLPVFPDDLPRHVADDHQHRQLEPALDPDKPAERQRFICQCVDALINAHQQQTNAGRGIEGAFLAVGGQQHECGQQTNDDHNPRGHNFTSFLYLHLLFDEHPQEVTRPVVK